MRSRCPHSSRSCPRSWNTTRCGRHRPQLHAIQSLAHRRSGACRHPDVQRRRHRLLRGQRDILPAVHRRRALDPAAPRAARRPQPDQHPGKMLAGIREILAQSPLRGALLTVLTGSCSAGRCSPLSRCWRVRHSTGPRLLRHGNGRVRRRWTARRCGAARSSGRRRPAVGCVAVRHCASGDADRHRAQPWAMALPVLLSSLPRS